MWAPVYQSTHVYIRWQLWELILYFYHVNLQNWTKDSCLVASPFTSWAISLAQMSYTDGETEALKRNNLQCVTNYEVWLDEEQEFWASRSNMSQEAQVGLSPVLSQHSIPGTSLQSLSSPHSTCVPRNLYICWFLCLDDLLFLPSENTSLYPFAKIQKNSLS